jgi:uncharacterized protein (TIGR02246 family)
MTSLKRPLLTLLAALVATVGSMATHAANPSPKGEEASKAAIAALDAAWGKGDAKAIAQLFTEDGSSANPWGQLAVGRAEIEKAFGTALSGPAKGSTHKITVTRVQPVSPTVVVLDGDVEVTGHKAPDGSAAPALHAKVNTVVTEQKGKWLIASSRAFTYLPPPPAPPPAAAPAPKK